MTDSGDLLIASYARELMRDLQKCKDAGEERVEKLVQAHVRAIYQAGRLAGATEAGDNLGVEWRKSRRL